MYKKVEREPKIGSRSLLILETLTAVVARVLSNQRAWRSEGSYTKQRENNAGMCLSLVAIVAKVDRLCPVPHQIRYLVEQGAWQYGWSAPSALESDS